MKISRLDLLLKRSKKSENVNPRANMIKLNSLWHKYICELPLMERELKLMTSLKFSEDSFL